MVQLLGMLNIPMRFMIIQFSSARFSDFFSQANLSCWGTSTKSKVGFNLVKLGVSDSDRGRKAGNLSWTKRKESQERTEKEVKSVN